MKTTKRADEIKAGDKIKVPAPAPSRETSDRAVVEAYTIAGWTHLHFDNGEKWTPRATRIVDLAAALNLVKD